MGSQCTFWCSVLSDSWIRTILLRCLMSQCTFWCSVLSDARKSRLLMQKVCVSMHLLVLSAFRLYM